HPKAHDHPRLRPTLQLEVMVQWRHAENAAAGQLVGAHLQNHRHGFHHEHAAHHEQYDLLAYHHGDDTERGTQRQRAHVTHEHLCGIGVEPEKTKPRTHDGAEENDQL